MTLSSHSPNHSASLCIKEVSTDWKTELVIPLFKKGNKASAENYHPTSITSAVTKILERVVNESVMKNLKLNGILSSCNQIGDIHVI